MIRAQAVLAILFMSALGGCSSDDPSTMMEGESTSITVTDIIFNPKSPGPGEMTTITAVVTGGSAVGDFPTYAWTSDGGTFITTGNTSVEWQAPTGSQVYTVNVTAKNSASTATRSEEVFVSDYTLEVAADAGQFLLDPTGNDLFYLSSPFDPSNVLSFSGFRLRKWDGTSDDEITTADAANYRFDRAVSQSINEQDNLPVSNLLFLTLTDHALLNETPLPTTPWTTRPPAFTNAFFSPDGSYVTYQAVLPDQNGSPAVGGVDTFMVFIHDINAGTSTPATTISENYFPSFSSDGNHLVFLSDRSGGAQWELYSLPFSGGTVPIDTLVGQPLRLSDTGGEMASGSPPVIKRFEWSPDPANPVLVMIDAVAAAGGLRFVPTDGSGAATVLGGVTDFSWNSSGSGLVALSGENVYIVDPSGGTQEIHMPRAGDFITQVSLSPDGEFVVYNVRRVNDSWFEFIDVGGATGLTVPLRISRSRVTGLAAVYLAETDIRPQWHPTLPIVYLAFFDGDTPEIGSVDLSGLTP